MFGYVKPVVGDLLVKEYEFYKAVYCGICRSMKKHTGALTNATLSYDSVLLALLRLLYEDDSVYKTRRRRCAANPIRKRHIMDDNPALEYTARAFAILSYHKLRDDLADEGVGKKLLLSPVSPIVKGGARRADMAELDGICEQKLSEISRLEAEGCKSVDEPASLFGELLGEIFAGGTDGEVRTVLYQIGLHLGRFIYAADAAEDYGRDVKRGRYNPYAEIYGKGGLDDSSRAAIKTGLLLECRAIQSAAEFLPTTKGATVINIVRNIIYQGLAERITFLDSPTKKE